MIRRLLLVPLLCAVACGESEELVQTRALLEECRSDKVAAQGAASACEDRYAREVRQWEDMEAVVSEVLPQTLADFREEREEILELVPEEARQEVEGYVERLSDMMGRGFQVLREENEATLLELEIAQTKLDSLLAATDSLEGQTGALADALERELKSALLAQERMSLQTTMLLDRVRTFDETYITDQNSPDRLRLNRNQRETIARFHASVLAELGAIGAER